MKLLVDNPFGLGQTWKRTPNEKETGGTVSLLGHKVYEANRIALADYGVEG